MRAPGTSPEGFTVAAVDWLPSGAHSGLVRVRGHRPAAVAAPLPELILEGGGEVRRFASLPDPGAERDPTAWRGAYVLEARPVAGADRLWLQWPGGRRLALPALSAPAHQARGGEEAAPPASGDVVDRAVLAERRARRAEASEHAQARICREALRAVEVLELRSSEIEERLIATIAERDALRGRAAAEPDARAEVLHQEVSALRAELERREMQPVAAAGADPEPAVIGHIPATEAERRAERLRGALAATIATVAELRMRLHEVEVVRRTRDVAASAEAVRLAVVERERQIAGAALDAARSQLRDARAARDAAEVELQGVQAAQHDLRSRYSDQSAELAGARRRSAELQVEVAAVRAEAQAAVDARVGSAEAASAAVQERLDRAQASLAGAETARELAEAAALAAASERRAAEVAHAAGQPAAVAPARLEALEQELDDVRAQLQAAQAATPPPAPPALRPAPDLVSAAAEQVRAAAQRAPAPEAREVAAAISAAADSLRARPTVVSPGHEPPADIARGRAEREYAPLRGALVKLAHDDAVAAGRLIAGLLGAQHLVFDAAPDYDLTIEEVGTFAVSRAGATTLVSPLDAPRGRPHAAFHLRANALTLAEILAGVDPRPRPRRRRGPLRASGSLRQARRMAGRLAPDVALEDLARAGAQLDPGLVLRALAYAVRPAWTREQTWAVELHVDARPFSIAALRGGGLEAHEGPHDSEPDARVHMSEADFRSLVAGGSPNLATAGDERVVHRFLALAERARGHGPN